MSATMTKTASIVSRMNATVKAMERAVDAQEKSARQIRTFQAELGGELLELSAIETQAVVIVRLQDAYTQAGRERTVDQRFVNRLVGYHMLVKKNAAFLDHGENVWQSYLPLFDGLKNAVKAGKEPTFKTIAGKDVNAEIGAMTAAQILATQATTDAWRAFTGETSTTATPKFQPAKVGEAIHEKLDTSVFAPENIVKQFKEMLVKLDAKQREALREALDELSETPSGALPSVPANRKARQKQTA